ncbi:MAG: 6-hydroxymethylpterin diphosphokinase MptE-like protein [Candidatus Heimdallarchaeota archaeon]
MQYEKWAATSWYEKIINRLSIDRETDTNAAKLLAKMVEDTSQTFEALKAKVQDKPVLIFGAGPSLIYDRLVLQHLPHPDCPIIIAADGATTALLEKNVVPHLIVSDLDGRIEHLIEANRIGAYIAIHAHGDNIPALKNIVPQFNRARIIGTVQVPPTSGLYNCGGFTDGDRAAFLADTLGASIIILAGFDLGDIVGQYSTPTLTTDLEATPRKRIKLTIAKELLEEFASSFNAALFNITAHGITILGFEKVTIKKLTRILKESC